MRYAPRSPTPQSLHVRGHAAVANVKKMVQRTALACWNRSMEDHRRCRRWSARRGM